jgi:transcriptional regulator with XRE-family HTH domain
MMVMTEINREEWRMKRLMKRITLTEIAKHLGCTHSLISMWESGTQMAEDKVEAYIKYIESK